MRGLNLFSPESKWWGLVSETARATQRVCAAATTAAADRLRMPFTVLKTAKARMKTAVFNGTPRTRDLPMHLRGKTQRPHQRGPRMEFKYTIPVFERLKIMNEQNELPMQ
jgi:hypothetical protein